MRTFTCVVLVLLCAQTLLVTCVNGSTKAREQSRKSAKRASAQAEPGLVDTITGVLKQGWEAAQPFVSAALKQIEALYTKVHPMLSQVALKVYEVVKSTGGAVLSPVYAKISPYTDKVSAALHLPEMWEKAEQQAHSCVKATHKQVEERFSQLPQVKESGHEKMIVNVVTGAIVTAPFFFVAIFLPFIIGKVRSSFIWSICPLLDNVLLFGTFGTLFFVYGVLDFDVVSNIITNVFKGDVNPVQYAGTALFVLCTLGHFIAAFSDSGNKYSALQILISTAVTAYWFANSKKMLSNPGPMGLYHDFTLAYGILSALSFMQISSLLWDKLCPATAPKKPKKEKTA